MTKKRALKLIMAHGIQRNEAQRLLLIAHEEGKTNLDAVVDICISLGKADRFFEKIVEAANALGVKLKQFADALSEMWRSIQ